MGINLFIYYFWCLLFMSLIRIVCIKAYEQIFLYCYTFNSLFKTFSYTINPINREIIWLKNTIGSFILGTDESIKIIDSFNENVLGYYIGLLGIYFAILIVVIQTYSKKRYLGYDVSKWVLFDRKCGNKSLIELIWKMSTSFISICIVLLFFKTKWINLLLFIIYFWIMAWIIRKYISLLVNNDYKKEIEKNLLQDISSKKIKLYDLTKKIKFSNKEELAEILDFFIEFASNNCEDAKNKDVLYVFNLLQRDIFYEKDYIELLIRKLNLVDDYGIVRQRYVDLPINHKELSVYFKHNLNDENFETMQEILLKIIGNQIHLTGLYSEFYESIFRYYLLAVENNKELSNGNKKRLIRATQNLLDDINKSDNKELLKIKYYVDFASTIMTLNYMENFKKLIKDLKECGCSLMNYVVIIIAIIAYIGKKEEYGEKLSTYLDLCINDIDINQLINYVTKIHLYIQDLYNGETYGITKKVDSSIENKIENVEQYIFIKKADKQDVSNLFKEEYNVVALTKKLNVIARFFSTNKTWIDEISEEEVDAYIKNKTNK